ncbi:Predicted Peptidoglycan domain-containing protein [Noviherbaspirillum humi]|uniref:Predicted Peptidoglycan domain-containing protein n=1 Tax=Noviherbaspirillum humi TaxID=1688639 RepID=A0A239LTV9_9BURK|nr:glycosyl hydrolase 108 family protein [Noviherbaspirillum humi]SNT33891.1 Predicted Peptidoglycan domain-containing protein [Noviherbaspirillum humi]
MSFDIAINRLLKNEGGYVKHPEDPGGETNWGLSKRSYPTLDIKNLTRDQAVAIYRRDFWEKIHADELPDGVAFQALDFAVNSGIDTAVRYLQRALGVADDGHWGPVTAAAARTMNEPKVACRLLAERLDFMRRLRTWSTFGAGWAGRVADNLRFVAEDM